MPEHESHPPSQSGASAQPRPALVYGQLETPELDLVFAPLDEAQRYADLRTSGGFPMTWGAFRDAFGDDVCEEFMAPLRENATYHSFEEFLYDGDEWWLDPQPPFGWWAWHRDYRKRTLPQRLRRGGPPLLQGESHLRFWYEATRHSELADVELRDWFEWCGTQDDLRDVRPATFEAFRAQVAEVLTQQMAEVEAAHGEEARRAYEELNFGDEGRAPTDSDQACFSDGDGNEYESPVYVSYWPAQGMLDWFPKGLARRYGRVTFTLLDGDYLALDGSRMDEIVAALEAEGFRCVEDSALLNVACGYR